MSSLNVQTVDKPRVVVIGGGFGGIELIRKLRNADVQIVLIDKNNYHTFQPLLYQVATAALEPDSIALPLRKVFEKQDNLLFRMAEVLNINPAKNSIETTIGELNYDFLVLANGSTTNFFGMEDFKKNALTMKSIPEALDMRSWVLQNFEKALLVENLKDQESLMHFVVVGGGPTGVEMAGALGELKLKILPRDYPELDINKMQIHVVEMSDRLFSVMSKEASEKGKEFLRKFDVNVWLNTSVKTYDGKVLTLSNGREILSQTVIWAAGVQGAAISGLNPEAVERNRVKVDQFSKVIGYENIFAIGDVSSMSTKDFPKGHPMLAPVAIQQGKLLSENLVRSIKKQTLQPFVYKDLGVMATVGRNRAVVDLKFVKFQGLFAWFVWMFVHLMALVSFRNRLIVFINWMWNFLSYERGFRLIIRPYKKS